MVEVLQNWKLQVLLSLFSIVIIYHILPILIYFIFILLAIVGGAGLAVIYQPGPYKRRDCDTFPRPPVPLVDVPLSKVKPYPPPSLKPKLLSSRIDNCLQDVLTLTLKYHVIPTYKLIGQDHEAFFKSITPNVWSVLLTLLQRMGQVDTMKLVSQDVVQLLRGHFENFRGIHYRDPVPLNKFPDLGQFPYLESPEQEVNFLRQVCEVLLCICLPGELLECTPVRVLIKEYLACCILQPTIDMICNPDYINQKMLVYLIKKEEATERGKKPMASKYKDFEDFMSQIKKCEDVEQLQILRQQIITDIIQAKAVYKMKQSHTTGLHGKQFPIPIPAEKLKVLMGRDLELYIRQLGTAKTSCDRQLRKQGGEEYDEQSTPVIGTSTEDSRRGEKPLGIPFETIMKNEVTRIFFLHFLEDCGCSHLLCFWQALEKLEEEVGLEFSSGLSKLYEDYLSLLSSELVHVEADLLKPIEDFMLGKEEDTERCVSTLAKIKESVYDEMRDGFYQNFIWSDHFRELMHHNTSGSAEGAFNRLDNIFLGSDFHADEESHHRKKLDSLKTKLDVKDKELSLMPAQVHSSQSLSQRKRSLQKDRSHLREEIKKLEHYLDHTEEWFDTIGQWSVEVHSVDLKEDEKDPLFVMIVHRLANRKHNSSDTGTQEDLTQSMAWQHQQQHSQAQTDTSSMPDSDETWSEISSGSGGSVLQSRSGWVLGRHLSEFEKLHEEVSEICPNLQFPPLPKWLNPFQRPDAGSTYWQKYRAALQAYLGQVLKDERLKECEEVFNFVSSASDNLTNKAKSAAQPERKNRGFSLSNVPVIQAFPGLQRFSMKDGQPEESPKELDSTAEYVYLLVSEIFELDHFSRVLRKQLVELVQLTYGKSIDREVQDTLNWVFSEPMLIFYLEMFKNGMWPGSMPAPPTPTRSDEEKAATKEEARGKFLKSSPQTLLTILGQRNCQIGMRKIFELLQDQKGNKQLFYALFEVLLYSIVPELEKVELDDDSSDWKDA